MFEVAHAQAQAAGEVASETGNQLTQLLEFIILQLPLWFAALIVLVLSFFVARIVKSSVENKLTTEGFEEEHKEVTILAGRTANTAVLVIGITVALKIAGIDLTAIIAAGAFGIGFALKDLIMNFIAGVMILSSKHFAIGDVIKVKNIMGKIVEIQTRATIVKNFDGTKVVIPNAELFKNPVTNLTSNPFRRVSVVTGVEYGSDLKMATKACIKAAKESKNALIEPKPKAIITEFSGSSINIKTNVWVESSKGVIKTKTDLIYNIQKELNAVGINIPFPITTVVFDKDKKKEQEKHTSQITKEEEQLDQLNTNESAETASEQKPAYQPKVSTEDISAPEWLKKAATMNTPQLVPQPAVATEPQVEATPQPNEPVIAPAEPDSQPVQAAPEQVIPAEQVAPVEQVQAVQQQAPKQSPSPQER